MSDRIAPSRLLLRLEAEIAGARSPLDADCKRAERAAYLARLGRIREARMEVEELQRRHSATPNARVSAWLHLVLGLVGHFSDMDPAARDRVLRAHALSTAANLLQLRALSAAWVAHMDYLQANVASMVNRASESLRLAVDDDHSTLSRANLVVAQAYHLAGRLDAALPWYGRARNHASAEGDEATLSALMHNMAWLRAQQLRVKGWMESESVRDESHALLGAESVASFDSMIGSTSLSALIPVLRAQIYTARGQYDDALALYEINLDPAIRDGMARLHADLLADQAWCRMNLGQTKEAREDAIAAETLIDSNGQFDDRAMAHGRLAQVFAALGDAERVVHHKDSALEAFAGHDAMRAEILKLLGESPETRLGESPPKTPPY
jgi:tetratricopeptide (TPR) repeat protein